SIFGGMQIGRVRLARGDLGAAPLPCMAAISRSISTRRIGSECQGLIGEVRAARDELAGARQSHEAALKLRQEIPDPWDAADSRVALARLSLEEGQPGHAGDLARAAAAEFARQ